MGKILYPQDTSLLPLHSTDHHCCCCKNSTSWNIGNRILTEWRGAFIHGFIHAKSNGLVHLLCSLLMILTFVVGGAIEQKSYPPFFMKQQNQNPTKKLEQQDDPKNGKLFMNDFQACFLQGMNRSLDRFTTPSWWMDVNSGLLPEHPISMSSPCATKEETRVCKKRSRRRSFFCT